MACEVRRKHKVRSFLRESGVFEGHVKLAEKFSKRILSFRRVCEVRRKHEVRGFLREYGVFEGHAKLEENTKSEVF